MKRLLTLAVFAFLACAGMATPAQAGSFGLFYCGRHGYDGAVSIRPYNAFSPVLWGDVTGQGAFEGGQGGCGAGGCGQGGYAPIDYRHGCGGGNCGQGGCGAGGYGYGWGQGGWDPRNATMNLRGPDNSGYTGSLGYNPPDGYGNGAFGTYGLGRLKVFGLPVDGGCLSCNNNWSMGTYSAPASCGPQGCAAGGAYGNYFGPNYGAMGTYPTPLLTPGTTDEAKPPLLQVPNKPKANDTPSLKLPVSYVPATTMQGSSYQYGYPAQPVSYQPGYNMPAQQMMPYGYTQPAWGYSGYQAPAYPAWGYQGW